MKPRRVIFNAMTTSHPSEDARRGRAPAASQ